jgi:hypothetical protein
MQINHGDQKTVMTVGKSGEWIASYPKPAGRLLIDL